MTRKAKKMFEPSPLQQLILDTLEKQGVSRYALAVKCGWAPHSIYRKLDRPTLVENIEKMFAALDIKVKSGSRTIALVQDGDGIRARTVRRT